MEHAEPRRPVPSLLRRAVGVLPGPRRTPVTFGYLVVLLATTAVLHLVSPGTAERLLADSSTNVEQLTSHPVRVLVTSALWLPGGHWLPYAVGFAATLGPLERRLGGLRTLLVVGTGHVLVSLLTEGGVAVGIGMRWLPAADASQLDVGASYLLMTAIGATLGLLPTAVRWPVSVTAAVLLAVPLWADPDMTAIGHLLCLVTGVAFWALLRRYGLMGTMWPGERPGVRPRPARGARVVTADAEAAP
ncbi:MAG TPA: rhomboid-like protein [Actinocatenispora sp.]